MRLASILVVFLLVLPTAQANCCLVYSWDGEAYPSGVEDPWGLGIGQGYTLSVSVDANAYDDFDVNPEFAAFSVTGATLTIDGEDLSLVGNGVIDFTDNSLAGYDQVLFSGEFIRAGVMQEFLSAVTLSSGAFSFTNTVERPPLFGTVTNVNTTIVAWPPYISRVLSGAEVRSIPEPTVIGLLWWGAVKWTARERRSLKD